MKHFKVNRMVVGIIFAVLTAMVILGGNKNYRKIPRKK